MKQALDESKEYEEEQSPVMSTEPNSNVAELAYETLLQQANEAKERDELDIAEKYYAQALRQALNQAKVDYDKQDACLKNLGDIYLAKKEYIQACALYNAAHIRCQKASYVYQEKILHEEVLIQCIKRTEKLFLEQALNRPIKETEISSWHLDHKQKLEALREHCRYELKAIEEKYPADKIYDYGDEENRESEIEQHELQLARAKQMRLLYQYIAKELKSFISSLIQECQMILGQAPCEYAIIGLGSLAREEATPYSDLEFAILIEDMIQTFKQLGTIVYQLDGKIIPCEIAGKLLNERNKQYFRKLTNLLHLKIINLGETILPGVAIPVLNNYYSDNPLDNWFYDDITPRGFAFDGAMPQACKTPLGKKDVHGNLIYELIQTPKEMAQYMGKKPNDAEGKYWFDYDPHLTMILMTTVLIDGHQSLLNEFKNESKWVLAQFRNTEMLSLSQIWALNLLSGNNLLEEETSLLPLKIKGDIHEFKIDLDEGSKEGKLYDVKKEIYRFSDRVLERLAIYFGIQADISFNRIEEMKNLGFVNQLTCDHLKIIVGITIELRLRAYLNSNSQQERMSSYYIILNQQSLEKNKSMNDLFKNFSLKQLFRFYFTALPLYKNVLKFCDLSSLSPAENKNYRFFLEKNFFKRNLKIQSKIYKRLLNYHMARDCLKKWLLKHPSSINELMNLGIVYTKLGKFEKANSCFKKIIERNKKQEHGDIIYLYYMSILYTNIGNNCIAIGEYSQAMTFHRLALMIQKQLYRNQPHFNIATSLNNLGVVYFKMGDFSQSITCCQQALAINEKLHLDDKYLFFNIILTCNLGAAYLNIGQFQNALKYYQQALMIEKQLYWNQPHWMVARTLNNVGCIYSTLGKIQQAIDYLKQAEEMNDQLYFNQAHPDVFRTFNNLGAIYTQLGKYLHAANYGEKALLIGKKLYNDKPNSSILSLLCNLANLCSDLGKYWQAIDYYQQAFNMQKQLYPNQYHPVTVSILNGLGNNYRALGLHQMAIISHQEAFNIQRKIHQGRSHQSTVSLLINAGNAYSGLGRHELAIIYYQQALIMQKELYGEDLHESIIDTLNNLGNAYANLEKYSEAIDLFRQAYALGKKFFQNKPHPQVARVLTNLASIYLATKQLSQAIDYYLEILSVKLKLYSNQLHPSIAIVLNNIGNAYLELKMFEKAIDYYQQAFAMRIKLYGDLPHPEVASSLNNLAAFHLAIKQFDQALSYFEKSLHMYVTLYGSDHPIAIKIKKNLIRTSLKIGNQLLFAGNISEAKRYYEIIKSDPEDINTQQFLLNSYYELNDLTQVIEHAKIMLLLNPESSLKNCNLACFLHVKAKLAKEKGNMLKYNNILLQAEIYFAKALNILSVNPCSSIYIEYANFLYQCTRYEDALFYLLKIISFKADDDKISYSQIEKSIVNDQLKAEIDFYGKIIIKAHLFSYYLLVNTYKKLNQITEAEKALNEFAKANEGEGDSLSFMLLGYAYYELGQLPAAAQAYKKAIDYYKPMETHPDYTLAREYLQKVNDVLKSTESKLEKEEEEEAEPAKALDLPLTKPSSLSDRSVAQLITQHTSIYAQPSQLAISPQASSGDASDLMSVLIESHEKITTEQLRKSR